MSTTTKTEFRVWLKRIGVFVGVALAVFGLLVVSSLAGLYDPSLTASVLLPLIAGGIASSKS